MHNCMNINLQSLFIAIAIANMNQVKILPERKHKYASITLSVPSVMKTPYNQEPWLWTVPAVWPISQTEITVKSLI